jgi:hypothetical protein
MPISVLARLLNATLILGVAAAAYFSLRRITKIRSQGKPLLQQNVDSFLGEMSVVREHIRDAVLAHNAHRNAVGEAVTFVRSRFIQVKARKEVGALDEDRFDL